MLDAEPEGDGEADAIEEREERRRTREVREGRIIECFVRG